MRLVYLDVSNFRNLESVQLDTDSRFVVFWGANAQGKTNLLEAIYALATLKGFRSRLNQELVRWDAQTASVRGRIEDEGLVRKFEFSIDARGRRVGVVDGKRPRDLSSYFQGIRAVLFAPGDTRIIRGEPALRRQFMDRAVFTARPAFLNLARDYRRVLKQRRLLLRQSGIDPLHLNTFDEQLVSLGSAISLKRAEIISELSTHFRDLHASVSGGEKAQLRYRSQLGDGDLADRARRFRELLVSRRSEELRRGSNLVGPHRADLEIQIGGKPARTFGSQGQIRSSVLALKLSELLAARKRGSRLIFLLDDLSSELDAERTDRLLGLLSELDLQTFITTTDRDRLISLPEEALRFLHVKAGGIPPEPNG